ncbi:hypothetical protein DKX38_027217 [Salix brachista]|uniref:FAS1 domain-containing protein n=1 Tax=Salix brachista TaxID=2182728 RepID=A0A5N5JBG7_9ROSI|nr:hypothetical protein DKX38_027217 [Salix brachista]
MATVLLFFLILLLISSSVLAASSPFSNALEILSASGYLSMALTLEITSKRLNLESSAATIFAPLDIAFARVGQLSALDLQYHISPLRLSGDYLSSLPFGTKIPTLLPNHSLTVTTSLGYFDGKLSINGISIEESALVDFGSLIIFGMGEFFSSSLEISPNLTPAPSPSPVTSLGDTSQNEPSGMDADYLGQASHLLMSRGYSIMGTFLDVQLFGIKNKTRLTIFAPVDQAMEEYAKNASDYSSIFRHHVVPGLFPRQDLEGFNDGTSLPTFFRGFMINLTRSGDVLVLNGVPLIFPDMYQSDWLVIHGLNQLLMPPIKEELVGESFSELDGGEDKPDVLDFDEYVYGSP